MSINCESVRIGEELDRQAARDRAYGPESEYAASVMATAEEIEAERVRKEKLWGANEH